MSTRNDAPRRVIIDGNEAAANVAYRSNEICAIYPITPSSPMGELADQWANGGRPNIWGHIPVITQMQSEGGVAGALHGSLQTGGLTTTFTASQGLLLMIPNMYKIAGELSPVVLHVAARSLAAQGLSIFGDHQDVMAVRGTGFALLCSASPQEAHDLALVAQAATLESRVPFVHFFDGFRTSHELNQVMLLEDEDLRALLPEPLVFAHRQRGLSPERPFIRGTSQNPDVYFQARETVNPFYGDVPGKVQAAMDRLTERCGRPYRLFDYHGAADAERVIVLMGSGGETAREAVDYLCAQGERVGMIQVRLYRPFAAEAFRASLPDTARRIAVLDRCKEPGSLGEPLFMDVSACLAGRRKGLRLIGGRYGLSSKEFTPAMVKAVFDHLAGDELKHPFTVGIHDDVSDTSLDVDPEFMLEPAETYRAVFYGLGADGTVGANKNSIKIIGSDPARFAQGYFVYDSKKSGSQTVSHLRFGPDPIRSAYLVQSANFVACHQFDFVNRTDVLKLAAPGATFLLNSPYDADEVWSRLPGAVRRQIRDKGLDLHVIDAYGVAAAAGLGRRINTVMQVGFFALSGVVPIDDAVARIKAAIEKSYQRKGAEIVRQNFAAVDAARAALKRVTIPAGGDDGPPMEAPVAAGAPDFVSRVTAKMIAGRGDELPVSALPVDGTWPSGTAAWERRDLSAQVPVWEPEICIQCGNCSLVCPHGVIRARFYDESELERAPAGFRSAVLRGRGYPEIRYTLQIHPDHCTGCTLCVDACPARSTEQSGKRAINMAEKLPLLDDERDNLAFFESLPEADRGRVDFSTVRGVQHLAPLFQFSGACSGCGETPYLKLVSQLFGDRSVIANATGCSSIYGGNLPTTPWSANSEGRGPAWSNSLFEDNAEFGFGFRLSADTHRQQAEDLLRALRPELGDDLVNDLINAAQAEESEVRVQRLRVEELRRRLRDLDKPEASRLESVADHLVRRSVWIVGGDGWAYDIGYGGLDHVLSLGRDVNILVLDTEVYSNTGGQVSKATPLAAVAKFAAGGKGTPKKDLALQAIAYGNVYVARVAMGANPQQTLLAFREAERFPGPSLILAYSHCIAHGIDMRFGMRQQKMAVTSGHWPLMRYNPVLREEGGNPFMLDSQRPSIRLKDYAEREIRYRLLAASNPAHAESLMRAAQMDIDVRWGLYEEMATRGDASFHFASAASQHGEPPTQGGPHGPAN
ncbi:MAG: pyruvate:ferredoxin (flavodoxin) oxidoreductase [Gammaproteobacteria bacterium]|jgi:pyruvate-ferredoxin/flavodoxin oxidoreductase